MSADVIAFPGPAPDDAQIARLYDERSRLDEAAIAAGRQNDLDGEAEANRRANHIDEQILRMPAHSFDGVAIKIRIGKLYAEHTDGTEPGRVEGRAIVNLAADLERLIGGADDAELVARIAQLTPLTAAHDVAWEEAQRLREVIDAMPDCPPLESPGRGFHYFLEKHGGRAAYDKANRLNEQRGAAVQAVMATPARTLAGVLAKLRIVAVAYGSGPGGEDHDDSLISWQRDGDSWLAAALAELERLLGKKERDAA